MGNPTRIPPSELHVGAPLKWAIYDIEGQLLMGKGVVVNSQRQLDALVDKGLFREADSGKSKTTEKKFTAPRSMLSPFAQISSFSQRLRGIFNNIHSKQSTGISNKVMHLAQDIQIMCKLDMNAALGDVHLNHDIDYVINHPIHIAILCELIATHMDYNDDEHLSLIAASLTCNVSIIVLQAKLQRQKETTNQEQQQQLNNHSERSADILKESGVDHSQWLETVRTHHERFDGKGPLGLAGENIPESSRLLALANRYAAMVSPRKYRRAMPASELLKNIYLTKNSQHDELLSLTFIKLMGIYPPGTFVRLANGEIAVVIKRPLKGKWPIVASIITPRGAPFAQPLRRDCNDERYPIKELYVPETQPRLNLGEMWGYKN
ncbi:MAG: hypothetical protein COB30_014270 [Ectothiorhodospiraceae bacterium]|nr:hypothetical protein [Ectothiorhodospiraceae bacterium]